MKPWGKIGLASLGISVASYLGIIADGHMMCADNLTGVLLLIFIAGIIAAIGCFITHLVRTMRRTSA